MTSGKKPKTLKARVLARIQRSRAGVFVPRDFDDLGDYDQVKRVLRKLVDEKAVTRLGYGVYAKLRTNPLTGQSALAARGGFDGAVRQTLMKLRVPWGETQVVRDYNAGRTTQIQVNAAYAVRSRFARKLTYKNLEAQFERAHA